MASKSMRKGEQTRAAILDVALEMASRDGLEGLTIGLLANLFTAVYVSRSMFLWVLNRGGRKAETLSI